MYISKLTLGLNAFESINILFGKSCFCFCLKCSASLKFCQCIELFRVKQPTWRIFLVQLAWKMTEPGIDYMLTGIEQLELAATILVIILVIILYLLIFQLCDQKIIIMRIFSFVRWTFSFWSSSPTSLGSLL